MEISPRVHVVRLLGARGHLVLEPENALRRPSRGRLFASITPTPARFAPIEDGDVLPVLGGLEVIHTPGHTSGSICLNARRGRLLFVGDTPRRRGRRVTNTSTIFSDDPAGARTSLRRLTSLDVKTIVFAPCPPVRQGASERLEMLARAASRPHATLGGRA